MTRIAVLTVAGLLALTVPASAESLSDTVANQQAQLAKMKAEFSRLEAETQGRITDMENEAFQRSSPNNYWSRSPATPIEALARDMAVSESLMPERVQLRIAENRRKELTLTGPDFDPNTGRVALSRPATTEELARATETIKAVCRMTPFSECPLK